MRTKNDFSGLRGVRVRKNNDQGYWSLNHEDGTKKNNIFHILSGLRNSSRRDVFYSGQGQEM